MKPRKLVILFLILLFTLLQTTALNYLSIFNNKPDLLLLLTGFIALNWGGLYGLIVGAVCGVFTEATSGIFSGSLVLSFSLGGLFLGYIGKWVYAQKIWLKVAMSFVFTLVVYLNIFLILQASGVSPSFLTSLIFIILPTCCYTAICAPVLFRFLSVVLS